MLRPSSLMLPSIRGSVLTCSTFHIGNAENKQSPKLLFCKSNFGFNQTSSYQKSYFDVKTLWDEHSSLAIKTERLKPSGSYSHKLQQESQVFKHVRDKQEELLNSMLENKLGHQNLLDENDWAATKKAVLETSGSINEENIDAIILSKCCQLNSLDLGKSYFGYLKSLNLKINLASYGNYLLLFYKCSSQCTDKDLKEIIVTYRELLESHKLLDSYTAEKVIFGLSITESWKEYEKLFKTIEVCYPPSPTVYSVVILTAFKNKNFDLGWKLLEEMQTRGIYTPDDVFINMLENTEKELKEEVLTKVLQFLCKFNIKPYEELSKTLKMAFEGLNSKRKGTFTYALRSGKCKNCNSQLEAATVLQEDYDSLKTAFLNPVLIGKDIFQKTKPEEFKEFLQFLEKTAPYDVVLDGLNIAYKGNKYKKTPSGFAFQLQSVVKHFCSKGKKVLVLGRKHMSKWPAEHMNYVFSNAEVFFAEDISQDDPFLLYATLYSGLGTRFVSQDMMRGHKFLLHDPRLQATFQKWQAQHQYFLSFIEDNGTVHIREPISFMQSIQQNSKGDWHIPFNRKEQLTGKVVVDNFHKNWLCLVKQPTQQVFENKAGNMKPERRKLNKFKMAG